MGNKSHEVVATWRSVCRVHNRTTYACSSSDKWLTKTPVFSLSSLHFRSSKEDMAWQSVLCRLQCFCWHFLEQYLTALQLLLCLKEQVPSFFPRNLRTWWDESVLAALCPADAAYVRFSTPFCILLQNDLLSHIWSNESNCLHLPSCMNCIVDAETVTGYQMHKAG